LSNLSSEDKHTLIGCVAISVMLVAFMAAVFTVVVVSIMWAASKFF
jgi:hypothetical protein